MHSIAAVDAKALREAIRCPVHKTLHLLVVFVLIGADLGATEVRVNAARLTRRMHHAG